MPRRTEQLAEVAVRLGYRFSAEASGRDVGEWHSLPIFRREPLGAGNLMSGEVHRMPVKILDWSYRSGRSRNPSRVSQTVVLLSSCAGDLPAFELGPRTLSMRLMGLLGFERIAFPTEGLNSLEERAIAEFHKIYHLFTGWEATVRMLATGSSAEYAVHEAALRRLFSPDLLGFLADRPGWSIQGLGPHLALSRPGGFIDADELPRWVAEAVAIGDSLSESARRSAAPVAAAPAGRSRWETVKARVFGSVIGLGGGMFSGVLLGLALAVFREPTPGRPPQLVLIGCGLGGLILGTLLGRFLLAVPIEWALRRRRGRAGRYGRAGVWLDSP